MFRSIAYIHSDNTTFDYFSDYLSDYYNIITFRNPLKYVEAVSNYYFPVVLIYIIIGSHPILVENIKLTRKIANLTKAVLITGETGTGKDLLAHYIHLVGDRRKGLIHIINCSTLNPALFESEFFGHRKVSYTGLYEHMGGHLLREL